MLKRYINCPNYNYQHGAVKMEEQEKDKRNAKEK